MYLATQMLPRRWPTTTNISTNVTFHCSIVGFQDDAGVEWNDIMYKNNRCNDTTARNHLHPVALSQLHACLDPIKRRDGFDKTWWVMV